MNIDAILQWLNATIPAQLMRDVTWVSVAAETLHFVGLSFLLGAMLIVDLRLLGLLRSIPIRHVMPLTYIAMIAFAVNLTTGLMFFVSNPFSYFPNPAFQTKMFLILLAGLNVVWFEVGERRHVMALADDADTPTHTKIVAGLSLGLWLAIVAFGRLLPAYEGATSLFE
jgi:hypothetical protein